MKTDLRFAPGRGRQPNSGLRFGHVAFLSYIRWCHRRYRISNRYRS
jgi:hypothetical protein